MAVPSKSEAAQPLRLLYITRAYGANAGGMERLSWEFANELKKNPSVQLKILAFKGQRRWSPFFNLTALLKAVRLSRDVDVVHIGDPLLSFLGWMVKKMTGRPVIVTVHGLDVAYANPLYQLYLRLFFQHFDLYLPISNYVGQLITSFRVERHCEPAVRQPAEAGEAISSNIKIITPGITDQYYNQSFTRQNLSQLLNRDTSSLIVLLTVGRLVPRKGQAWFIANVLPKLPDNFLYVIAGGGPDHTRIQQAAAEAKQTNKVLLLGRVSDKQLSVLYNTADAFIQPNISVPHDPEGFGLVLLEAALCELPVFAGNIEGIPDAIQDNQNGQLIPSQNASAWIKTLNNFTQNKQRQPNSRRYTLERFSWPATISAYLSLIFRLKNRYYQPH